MSRRTVAVGLALAAVLVAVVSLGTAWARRGPAGGRVAASSPADAAVLAAAPSEVVLTFTAPPDPTRSHVTVWTGPGASANTGPLRAAGRHALSQPVDITASGDVTVAYHVVFTGGGEITGTLRYSVGTGRTPPAGPRSQAAASAHDHGVDPLGGALLGADVAVLAGVVVLLLVRPGPRRPATR